MTVTSLGYRKAAVVGAGTIGSSWAALFLAHGLRVCVSDPRSDVEEVVRASIDEAAPTLRSLGLATEGLEARLAFEPDLEKAVYDVDVVQENGPEKLEVKRELFGRIFRAAPSHALLLTSTSAIPATALAADLPDPGRVLVGHPFNPPHLLPLVEVVPGERTSPESVERAVAFYRALGKHPVVVRKETQGFVANRLQVALIYEAVNLVLEGVVSEADLDEVVTSSLGIRWAATGPFLSYHLGGGPGGMENMLTGIVAGLGFDEQTIDLLSEQAREAFGSRSYEELAAERDRRQLAVMRALGWIDE